MEARLGFAKWQYVGGNFNPVSGSPVQAATEFCLNLVQTTHGLHNQLEPPKENELKKDSKY